MKLFSLEKLVQITYHINLSNLTRLTFLNVPIKSTYKTFVRPHLGYGDILYDKPNNENFQNKLEKVQYRACLAITGAIQGTSRTKLYDELGLHSLIKRRWCNKLIFFYKIVNGLLPGYLYSYLDFPSQINYSLRSVSASVIKLSLSRQNPLRILFFRIG